MDTDELEVWRKYAKGVTPLRNRRAPHEGGRGYDMNRIVRIAKKCTKVESNIRNWRDWVSIADSEYAQRHAPTARDERRPRQVSRRNKRRFRSGMTMDLHGHTRNVDEFLRRFCISCAERRIKMVTIVTGKGSGVVREATLRWLETNSDVVADFFEVVDVSGSSGAYGVYLRL